MQYYQKITLIRSVFNNIEPTTKKPEVTLELKQEPISNKEVTNLDNTYFVDFKANIKGDRKKLGFIIQTDDETKIPDLVSKKLKTKYTGVRTINCVNYRKALSTDEEYIEDISSVTRIASDKSSEDTNEINQQNNQIEPDNHEIELDNWVEELFKALKALNRKCFKIICTPGRVPKLKDMSNYSYSFEQNESIILFKCRHLVEDLGLKFKDKWVKILPVSQEEFRNSPSVEDLYQSYKQFNSEMNIDTIKNFKNLLDNKLKINL